MIKTTTESDITLDSLEKKLVIDFGHRSRVWLVEHRHTFYALKEVAKAGLSEIEVRHLFEEKQALSNLKHPNIIKLITTFKDHTNIYFLLELAKGAPLSHILKQQRRFPLEQVQSIALQIANTLAYIHAEGYIYRDLKLSNVLLDDTGKVVFVDLGLCKKIDNEKAYTVTGTRHAMSPEMFKHLIDGTEPCGYSYEIDWWALGILTYELLKSSPPFGLYGEDLFPHILRGLDYVDMTEIGEFACDFIRKLLNPDFNLRLGHNSSNEVLDHQFLRTATPLIVPNSTQLQVIQSWCEFIDPSEQVSEQDLFREF